MHLLLLLYILVSLAMGLMGANRKFGFWGYFFASLLLSPAIGLVLLLASDPRRRRRHD